VTRIMCSSVDVHHRLVLCATWRGTSPFERWRKVPAVEVGEEAPGVATSGEEPAGLLGCAGREG
jgi:hypothetical protein